MTAVGHPFDTIKVRLQTQPMDKPIYGTYYGRCSAFCTAACQNYSHQKH